MFRYLPIEESFCSSELGNYISYGISVIDSVGNEVKRVSDVSLNESFVSELCEKCTTQNLDAIHLFDIIEDNL